MAKVVVRIALLRVPVEGVLDPCADQVEQRLCVVQKVAPRVGGQERQPACEPALDFGYQGLVVGVGERLPRG